MNPVEKIFYCLRKPSVILSYVLLLVLVYCYVDKAIATYFYQLDLRHNLPLLNKLTDVGRWYVYLLLFITSGVYYRYVRNNHLYEQRSWYLAAVMFLITVFGFVLKVILSRARPELWFTESYFGFYWLKLNSNFWSFPSGHTMTMVGLAAGVGSVFAKYFYPMLILALMIILTRVVLYFHYLSDVMAGVYLAILIVGFFGVWLKKRGYRYSCEAFSEQHPFASSLHRMKVS